MAAAELVCLVGCPNALLGTRFDRTWPFEPAGVTAAGVQERLVDWQGSRWVALLAPAEVVAHWRSGPGQGSKKSVGSSGVEKPVVVPVTVHV